MEETLRYIIIIKTTHLQNRIPFPCLKSINGSAAWGDYDNDGDQDIIITGNYGAMSPYTISTIYRNNNKTSNKLPNIPFNLKATINGNGVTLIWDKSTDSETPQNGLTYNLMIGTSPGSCDISIPDVRCKYR